MSKLADAVQAIGIQMKCTRVVRRPGRLVAVEDGGWPLNGQHWLCSFSCDGRRAKFFFSRGTAGGADPIPAEVLYCVLADAQSVDSARGFKDWAEDLGWSEDSRRAWACWQACLRSRTRVKRLLGDHYDALCEAAMDY